MSLNRNLVAGGLLYVASAYGFYHLYANRGSVPSAPKDAEAEAGSTFDRIAPQYDAAVGSEEWGMGYGIMRWWLIRQAKGDVLEISAGTGRNLPHYPMAHITSLTLCDVSPNMLQRAAAKYYDDMQLGYRHPEVQARFVLADAEHMVAPAGQAPREVPVHTVADGAAAPGSSRRRGAGALAGAPGDAPQGGEAAGSSTGSVWRFKRRRGGADAAPAVRGEGGGESSAAGGREAGAAAGGAPAATVAAEPSASRTWWPARCACSPAGGAAAASGGADAGQLLSTFLPASYDYVVDTFGLCSCSDPVQVLRQAAALLRPGGRLLLLEHGRASYGWLNRMLDDSADKHHRQWGCWWNRDMLGILEQAGLDVVSASRWHFGTSYLVTARPPQAPAAAA